MGDPDAVELVREIVELDLEDPPAKPARLEPSPGQQTDRDHPSRQGNDGPAHEKTDSELHVLT
jgi:hypothetical protein